MRGTHLAVLMIRTAISPRFAMSRVFSFSIVNGSHARLVTVLKGFSNEMPTVYNIDSRRYIQSVEEMVNTNLAICYVMFRLLGTENPSGDVDPN